MTEAHNPYAPPQAAVADIASQENAAFQPVKIFGAKGRIGRMRYFAYLFAAGACMNIIMWIVSIFGSLASVTAGVGSGAASPLAFMAVWALPLLFVALSLIFFVLATIQRGHDMNLSGWFTLLAFIPLAVFVWLLVPGSNAPNRHGAPPPPNSTGVKVLFWIGIGLTILWILLFILLIVMLQSFAGLAL